MNNKNIKYYPYKSYGEKLIASILSEYNLNFIYENPLLINETKYNDSKKERIWYPDFWLPDYSIIIEFFGRENDENYFNGTKYKLKTYKKLNLDCIPVYPKTLKKDLKSYILFSIKDSINKKLKTFNYNQKIPSFYKIPKDETKNKDNDWRDYIINFVIMFLILLLISIIFSMFNTLF